jgi:hypothetical protein
MNNELTWNDQVSNVCRNVLFTLRRVWTMWHSTPLRTCHKLMTSLIVPQILYCDVIFSISTARLRERLKVTFNSSARYIFGISITQYTNQILGIPLDQYYRFRNCCTMNNITKTGCPRYLFTELQFDQSRRLFNIIIPVHKSSQMSTSFIIQGSVPHGMVCHLMSRERGALRSLGKSVCHICADRG